MSENKNNASGELGPIKLFADGSDDTPFDPERMNQIVRALNALLNAEIKRGDKDAVFISGRNTVIQIKSDEARKGQTVYVKCCLADGTEAFVPLNISGTIYAVNTGTVTAPDIDPGSVPDGSKVLE